MSTFSDAPEYLITGGAGFIGSNTVRILRSQGKTVRILDNFSVGNASTLPEPEEGVEVIEGDIRDPEVCKTAVRGVRYILHMAAESSVQLSVTDPLLFHSVNATGTLNLLLAARDAGVERWVLSSSCSVYGEHPELPKTEKSPVAPASPYALTKRINEEYSLLFHKLYGLPACVLRYFNVYGPGQRPDSSYAAVIPFFLDRCRKGLPLPINGDGDQTRDFVYVDDVVQANLAACHAGKVAIGRVFNIGSGHCLGIRQLAEMIGTFGDNEIQLEFSQGLKGEVRDSLADARLADAVLGWVPKVTMEDGIRRTWEWMQQSGQAVSKD